MSKLSEYLALVPEGLKNIDGVLNGLKNNLKLELGNIPIEHEEEILRRRLICSTCPFMSKNAVAAGTYVTARTDEHCIMCGCPIKTKTSSLYANCGIETYNIKNPDNQIPLKWEKYKPNDKD